MNIAPHIIEHAARIDARHASGQVWNDGKYRTAGSIGRGMRALTHDEIRACAPSVFAEGAHKKTSARYSFLPTASVLSGMEREGWAPTLVQQQGTRDESRQGFQKHMIRFARLDDLGRDGDRPEIVLINAHDTSSSYILHAGIFRTYCLNGLIACDATFERRSITHLDFEPSKVIEASFEMLKDIPRLMDGIQEMKQIQLTEGERGAFAAAATVARWESLEQAPIHPGKLLIPQRTEDAAPTLWNTLNTVQERIVKGGMKDWSKRNPEGKRMPKSRAVKGIDGNIGINKALWTLAEEMKRLKA